jgi:tRNA (guanine-N7-)-methyltransferase
MSSEPNIKPADAPRRNFYGRRRGKALRKNQIKHLDTTLEAVSPKGVSFEENPERNPIDLAALFGNDKPVWLEIGFGGGEHLLHMAQTYPAVNLRGVEAFLNGVAKIVPLIDEHKLTNARVHWGDARDLLEVLPEGSLDKVFLLYPDPWHKTRHHARRFVNAENLDMISRALKPGAMFRVATDIENYVHHTLERIMPRDDFEWLAETPQDWREPWSDWTRTRYEAKAVREGRTPHYLTFRKI